MGNIQARLDVARGWQRPRALLGLDRRRRGSRPAARAARVLRLSWSGLPLWLRLMTGVLVLVTAAMTVTAVTGSVLMRTYLADQADNQLRNFARHVGRRAEQQHPPVRMPSPVVQRSRMPSQFLVMDLDPTGKVKAVIRTPTEYDESQPVVPALTWEQAKARNAPFTVPSQGHGPGGPWRLLVARADVNGTTLVGSSLSQQGATVSRLLRIDLFAGAATLLGLAVAGYAVVRVSLRPLLEVETTAVAIAAGDLSSRVPDRDPRTEVGRLSRAVNLMLSQIEQALRDQEASETAARHSELRMRRFVADASHELRTPLASIRGFAELYRQREMTDPDQGRRLMRLIEEEAVRVGMLVDDLLTLARLDQERELASEPVDLLALAADSVQGARARAPDRPVALVLLDMAGSGEVRPMIVPGDELRLRQVLDNLINNALRHTSAGTPVAVRVGTFRRRGARMAVLEVSDSGPGLSPDHARRVFERFYRVDPARSRSRGGTGLGLAIVAAIVAAHGGTVEVDTVPGQGATFRVLLPAA
jgi:two-component system OmpR family sensor kinase